ncbi:MAG: phosphonopyruvate decarboxylase [Akkermansiaceae bacterium]
MVYSTDILKKMQAEGIEFFTGVPDSLLESFCACVTSDLNDREHVIAANEGAAVALATGYYLATGKAALVYMQNSGIGNAINPLLSLAHQQVFSVPMLLMIGWRGEPGIKDEPQHLSQGEATLPMLETADIPCHILPSEPELAYDLVAEAHQQAIALSKPVAIIVRKNILSSRSHETFNEMQEIRGFTLTREQVLKTVVNYFDQQCAFVATTGKTSRELFEIRQKGDGARHKQDFLTVGSMGHCSQISLGIALAQENQQVVCLDGDGAMLMHMGSLAIVGQSGAKNIVHVILNNGAHESVGSQPTVALKLDMEALGKALGYEQVMSCVAQEDLQSALACCDKNSGPTLIEIKIKTGSREDLGRPDQSPKEYKRSFMSHLRKGIKPLS